MQSNKTKNFITNNHQIIVTIRQKLQFEKNLEFFLKLNAPFFFSLFFFTNTIMLVHTAVLRGKEEVLQNVACMFPSAHLQEELKPWCLHTQDNKVCQYVIHIKVEQTNLFN